MALLLAAVSLLCVETISGYAVGKMYIKNPSMKLEGCVHCTANGVPAMIICSQLCNEEVMDCQSFNYDLSNKTYELNSCTHADELLGTLRNVTLVNESNSDYYQMTNVDGTCNLAHRGHRNSCHPLGTDFCTAATDLNDTFTPRTCNCHSFASGPDCSKVLSCDEEGMCLEYHAAESHDSAVSTCASSNGFLMTVDSVAESHRIRMFLDKYYGADVHLGIRYYDNYGDFAYTNNKQPVTGYTNWLEVKAADSRHNCVKLSSSDNYRWVDVNCTTELPFICEVPQCPSGFQAFNGSCYYFDSDLRTWDRNADRCYSRDSVPGFTSYAEEEAYLKSKFNSTLGNVHPVSGGLHHQFFDQKFMWLHNGWIPLDFDNKMTHLGCYGDNSSAHSIASLEGNHSIVSDAPTQRDDPVLKCFYSARWESFEVFGIQNGGTCRSDGDALNNYKKYGETSNCMDGEGGESSNDIYRINDHNVYLDIAFDSEWNSRDKPLLSWSHNESRMWKDNGFNTSLQSLCKIELCPQGFIPFENKCFKFVTMDMSRDDARDNCQRYRGADLFNPEYSDELTFLQSTLTDAGITGRFWNGIEDVNLDGNRSYQVTQNPVDANYNIVSLGPEPIWRTNQDGESYVTSVEMRHPFTADGTVVGWEYYSGAAGRPITFSVMRAEGTPQPGNCNFTLVGVNSFSSSVSGYDRIDLSDSDYISVKPGDYIAMTFTGGSNIRFNEEADGTNFCLSTQAISTAVSTAVHLSHDSGYGRIYSFRALWIPKHLDHDSLYNGNQTLMVGRDRCFVSDTTVDMRVQDSNCSDRYKSICEIKKRHRTVS